MTDPRQQQQQQMTADQLTAKFNQDIKTPGLSQEDIASMQQQYNMTMQQMQQQGQPQHMQQQGAPQQPPTKQMPTNSQ